jgi:hypothetical protein
VRLTVGEAGIRPQRVQVNAFLGIRLVVRNTTKRERLVSVRGARPSRGLGVGPGVRATLDLDGLRPGRYRIVAEPGGSALLVVERPTP